MNGNGSTASGSSEAGGVAARELPQQMLRAIRFAQEQKGLVEPDPEYRSRADLVSAFGEDSVEVEIADDRAAYAAEMAGSQPAVFEAVYRRPAPRVTLPDSSRGDARRIGPVVHVWRMAGVQRGPSRASRRSRRVVSRAGSSGDPDPDLTAAAAASSPASCGAGGERA